MLSYFPSRRQEREAQQALPGGKREMTQDQLNEIWRLYKAGQPVDENVRACTIGGNPVIDALLPEFRRWQLEAGNTEWTKVPP
jgi:hypothetical protein